MTKRLRGIWHAWHFQFALSLVVTALCGSFCIACLHPLTRRYSLWRKLWISSHYFLNMKIGIQMLA
ncbi:hypothetical protein CYU11_11935 [Vibrio parahaemolyticus]|nr:hypothetical protein CYU11_11935 [Vibrio parahaemolyticus]